MMDGVGEPAAHGRQGAALPVSLIIAALRESFGARCTAPTCRVGSPMSSRRLRPQEATMSDRSYVERAAAVGAAKIELLLGDPARYLLRSVGAGMGLTLVVF